MSIFLLNRSPEPNETGIFVDEHIYLQVVDDSGADIDLAATQVYFTPQGGPEELAFDAGVFQAGYNGAASATSAPALGIRDILIDLTSDFNSLDVNTVRVVSANNAGVPDLLNESYSFTVQDLTPPQLLSAEGRDLRTVRLTYSEVIKQTDSTSSDDALNPSNYSFTRIQAPAVNVTATSVGIVTPTTVDVSVNIDISPGRNYSVTVTGVEDVFDNTIVAPNNVAVFRSYEPPYPADRQFNLYELLATINRQEDLTEDLSKFIACLQEITDLQLWDLDRWTDDLLDPDSAQEQYVDAMLADLGNPFAFAASLSLVDKRRLIRVLLDIYRLKGTEKGVVDTVRFFLGLTIYLDEYINTEVWVLGESELGGGAGGPVGPLPGTCILGPGAQFLLYSFVVVSGVTLTDDQKDKITQIVEYMKPAHTHFLGFVEPTLPVIIDHLELGLSELGVDWTLH